MTDKNYYDLTDHFHADTPATRAGVSTRDPGGPIHHPGPIDSPGRKKPLVGVPNLKGGSKPPLHTPRRKGNGKPPKGVRPQTVPTEFVYTPYP